MQSTASYHYSIKLNQQKSDKERRATFFFNVRLYVIKQISVALMAMHQNLLWPIATRKTERPLTCSVSSQTFQTDPLLDLHHQ